MTDKRKLWFIRWLSAWHRARLYGGNIYNTLCGNFHQVADETQVTDDDGVVGDDKRCKRCEMYAIAQQQEEQEE